MCLDAFRLMVATGICAAVCSSAAAEERVPAFPGAEGCGAWTPGGRGGVVLAVTSLDDYDPGTQEPIPGTLRAACDEKGPRIVVFRVSGIIELKEALAISEPYLTIAGQSAPGKGVCLKDCACVIRTHDVVVRHIRIRPGDLTKRTQDALSIGGSRSVIVDHCSTSWGNDEVLSVSGAGQTDITVQWCLITESLDASHHEKGAHGYGSLLRTDGNVSFHHNLYAHHRSRCPRPGTYGEEPGIHLDFRNNVIYNWGGPAGYSAKDPVHMNYVGNYLKPGPSTNDREYAFHVGGETTHMFVSGNVLEGREDAGDWELVAGWKELNKLHEPLPVGETTTESAETAFERVLAEAGATLPARDAVDVRLVGEVRERAGRIINTQEEVGGWPQYAQADAPADTDEDGMPDKWEVRCHLNPDVPSDAADDADGDGYTNVEEFLNETDPNAGDNK